MKSRVKILLDDVRKWAESRPDILGVALVGSYACGEGGIDSDVDLLILASDPSAYIDKPEWINHFGSVKSFTVEDWRLVSSLRVYYQKNLEVEFGMTTSDWATEPFDDGTRQVITDGMKILLDRTGLLDRALKQVPGKGGS
jgi:predicted nucleotidyltransferase